LRREPAGTQAFAEQAELGLILLLVIFANMSQKIFRMVILSAIALKIFCLILAFFMQTTLPPDLLRQKADMIRTWPTHIPGWMNILTMFLPFFVLMGLYYFRKHSREVFVALTILGFFLALDLGPSIEPRIVAIFGAINTLLHGFIIALIYCSRIADEFRVLPRNA
jgi:hypothetical protein